MLAFEVVAWGRANEVGDTSSVSSSLQSGVQLVVAGQYLDERQVKVSLKLACFCSPSASLQLILGQLRHAFYALLPDGKLAFGTGSVLQVTF